MGSECVSASQENIPVAAEGNGLAGERVPPSGLAFVPVLLKLVVSPPPSKGVALLLHLRLDNAFYLITRGCACVDTKAKQEPRDTVLPRQHAVCCFLDMLHSSSSNGGRNLLN